MTLEYKINSVTISRATDAPLRTCPKTHVITSLTGPDSFPHERVGSGPQDYAVTLMFSSLAATAASKKPQHKHKQNYYRQTSVSKWG